MLVSIITTAMNEEAYLPGLFSDFLNQTYPHDQIEIILMNSMSTDKTRDLMLDFQAQFRDEFYDIQVHNNLRKSQASGLNEGIKVARGECVLKVDAHATIPEDFVEQNVAVISQGEFICGGKRPTIIESDDPWSKTLHQVEEAMLGSSIASYRKADSPRYVKSIFHGMYKKSVFDHVGELDERLGRTEDNEIHDRLLKSGYQIKYDPRIVSYQYMRPNFQKMVKQKYSNGYWIGMTSHVRPSCLSLYHFVPFVFTLAVIFSILMLPVTGWFLGLLALAYFGAMAVVTGLTIRKEGFLPHYLAMPFLLLAVHLAYGVGTIVGLFNGLRWRQEYFAAEQDQEETKKPV